ncbi:UDP-N-acetylmuramoyl-tripeptide--D-alanyl-D-alanine ligase [Dysgonomonas massiliensis]|uniref:UDP-N-acetylmuramoyl-tripeptide--D-alanyl-D- alanine ligase n=1 Tax=Dysgonomonas massiliensis TaxID=2040292 RepID=UPI000C78C8F1|nr:UDP-N-acetylmuramoyl-tripeptide--D-alanyl-D-alanine ligase [Dysgonomonas massiliensis]
MSIQSLYEIYKKYPVITTDSRNCPTDSIFFALKGPSFNGNAYAEQAIKSGCSYAIVDEVEYATLPNTILVDDVLKTLQQLANYHRKTLRIPIIGITGTNGKTTTKELVSAVLTQEHNVIATSGNFNNHIGVPLTLLRIRKEHEIAIVEMGANHMGEIKELCEIAEPNFGLITNIGHAHIEGFGSYENIIKTKGELYDYIRLRQDGKIFVDYDNELLRGMSEGIASIYYGLDCDDNQFVTGKVLSSSPYLVFEWKMATKYHKVETKMIGSYNLSNALAAITIGKYFGIKGDLISKAISEYVPTNNRSQLKATGSNMLIIDAYNANPTSMIAALQNFDQMEVGRKVLILGEMKELGADSGKEHENIVDYVQHHDFDEVMLVGRNFAPLSNSYKYFEDVVDLQKYLEKNPVKDSYVLLKGSRGVQLEKVVDLL